MCQADIRLAQEFLLDSNNLLHMALDILLQPAVLDGRFRYLFHYRTIQQGNLCSLRNLHSAAIAQLDMESEGMSH